MLRAAVPVLALLLGGASGFAPTRPHRTSSVAPCATEEAATEGETADPDRPFTLPTEAFRPKQSLGQNYLSDQNYVRKICGALTDDSPRGSRVVELGPGTGALSRTLVQKYPEMTAVEIDGRAVEFLAEKLPNLRVLESDVLQIDYRLLSHALGGPISVIGNLPYHITSQILFCIADAILGTEDWDAPPPVNRAVVTMQYEVAERLIAPTKCKDYGILSVVFQLLCKPKINFKIPPTVFFPQPKVDSALVTFDFTAADCGIQRLQGVDPNDFKTVLRKSFQQRRKMLRASLKNVLPAGVTLPDEWGKKRPEALSPEEFVELTMLCFPEKYSEEAMMMREMTPRDPLEPSPRVWRKDRHGAYANDAAEGSGASDYDDDDDDEEW